MATGKMHEANVITLTISKYCTKPICRDHIIFFFYVIARVHLKLHGFNFESGHLGLV